MPLPLGLFLMTLSLLISACSAPDVIQQEREIFEQQVANHPALTRQTLAVEGNSLFYVTAGDSRKPALIIVHGTPGSWQQYARYLLDDNLLAYFYVVVIDRPGWGNSTLATGNIASFKQQATIFAALARELKRQSQGQPVIVMGHSLGASIAPRAAMDFPELFDGLLLFAGTLDPALGNPRWYNHFANLPGMGLFLDERMLRANDEIYALTANLEAMVPLWPSLKAQTLVVQGMADELVYPSNVYFAEKNLSSENTVVIQLQGQGHLFPMTLRQEVADWAVCVLQRVRGEPQTCLK